MTFKQTLFTSCEKFKNFSRGALNALPFSRGEWGRKLEKLRLQIDYCCRSGSAINFPLDPASEGGSESSQNKKSRKPKFYEMANCVKKNLQILKNPFFLIVLMYRTTIGQKRTWSMWYKSAVTYEVG